MKFFSLAALAIAPVSAVGVNFLPENNVKVPQRVPQIHARSYFPFQNDTHQLTTTIIEPTSTIYQTNMITLTIQRPKTSTAAPTVTPVVSTAVVETATPSTILSYDSSAGSDIPVTVVQVTSKVPVTLTQYETVTMSTKPNVEVVTVNSAGAENAINSAVADGATVNMNNLKIYDTTKTITVTIPVTTKVPISSDASTTIYSTITAQETQTVQVTSTITETLTTSIPKGYSNSTLSNAADSENSVTVKAHTLYSTLYSTIDVTVTSYATQTLTRTKTDGSKQTTTVTNPYSYFSKSVETLTPTYTSYETITLTRTKTVEAVTSVATSTEVYVLTVTPSPVVSTVGTVAVTGTGSPVVLTTTIADEKTTTCYNTRYITLTQTASAPVATPTPVTTYLSTIQITSTIYQTVPVTVTRTSSASDAPAATITTQSVEPVQTTTMRVTTLITGWSNGTYPAATAAPSAASISDLGYTKRMAEPENEGFMARLFRFAL